MKASFTCSVAAMAIAASVIFSIGTTIAEVKQTVIKLKMTGAVYTADERGNSISAIDLASGKVTTVPVPVSPHNVQITADGALLLAVGEPVNDDHGHGTKAVKGQLLVFASNNLEAGPVASIQVGSHPAHVVVDRAGRWAFVTNAGDNAVAVVDLSRKMVVRTVPTGRSPHGLRISPDGREVYVANVEDGSVSVIDTTRLAELARIGDERPPGLTVDDNMSAMGADWDGGNRSRSHIVRREDEELPLDCLRAVSVALICGFTDGEELRAVGRDLHIMWRDGHRNDRHLA